MKYSIPKQIDPTCEADGILFFAQRLEEMLANNSIDLYKMPLLNTHSLAAEYCDVVSRVNAGSIKEYQRNEVYNEFIFSFSNDIVLKKNWGIENIERVTKSFGSCTQTDKDPEIGYTMHCDSHTQK